MAEIKNVNSKLDLLAEILGVTPRRIQQLAEDNIIPKPNKAGAYDIPECVRCYYYNEFAIDDEDGLDGRHERARKAKAEADRIEFDLAIKQKKYVLSDLVEYSLEKVIGVCRAKLLALPRKLAPLISTAESPSEAEDILTEGVNEALNDLVKPVFDDDTDTGITQS